MGDVVEVRYQDRLVGAVSDHPSGIARFEYDQKFIESGIELAPLRMPLRHGEIYHFDGLNPDTYRGLPGMLADSLPDDFGKSLLNAWAIRQGKQPSDVTALERLQYIGIRGMGALTYRPANKETRLDEHSTIDLEQLLSVAQKALRERKSVRVGRGKSTLNDEDMATLLSVGTSAGGARAKAVLGFNDDFNEVRSGQVTLPDGFTHYLLKFDGVTESDAKQQAFGDPSGYGVMEYVYHRMARACGITMMPCRLLDEGGRRHFLTQRFDRVGNQRIHVQTLNAIAHVDYKRPGAFSYEELFNVMRELRLPVEQAVQMLRRMVFNVVARNHDDHSKNVSFLLNEQTHQWELAPAYDLAYSYKPGSKWVNNHFMTLNGKRDDFTREDLLSFTQVAESFTARLINDIVDETVEVVSQWPVYAKEEGVSQDMLNLVKDNLRLFR